MSLKRFLLPLILLTVFFSGINFLFLDYVFPHATLKQKNMFNNLKKKQPALALIPGTFNTEIPGYIIKFDEKYGEENNFLRNVQISDLTANRGKIKVITSSTAEITTEEGSKYMTLTLKDGNYYEDYIKRSAPRNEKAKMPFSNATFDTYVINIDISSFNDEDNLNKEDINIHCP
ncbi:MAG: LptF/LptG family permease [Robiginitomaculum sp.]|nr:LptF/LptG family permease [Robiginitomaculum sp.]